MLEVLKVADAEDSIRVYAAEYERIKQLLASMESEAHLIIDVGAGGFVDVDDIFSESHHLERIKDDLEVYLIELRKEIRDILNEDEETQTGTVSEKTEPIAPPGSIYPKNDYRRHTQEDKEDDLK